MRAFPVSMHRTCSACPSQWDLHIGESAYYARYRFGHLAIHRASFDGSEIEWPATVYEWDSGDEWDGEMSDAELIEHLSLARLLPTAGPIHFTHTGWGHD